MAVLRTGRGRTFSASSGSAHARHAGALKGRHGLEPAKRPAKLLGQRAARARAQVVQTALHVVLGLGDGRRSQASAVAHVLRRVRVRQPARPGRRRVIDLEGQDVGARPRLYLGHVHQLLRGLPVRAHLPKHAGGELRAAGQLRLGRRVAVELVRAAPAGHRSEHLLRRVLGVEENLCLALVKLALGERDGEDGKGNQDHRLEDDPFATTQYLCVVAECRRVSDIALQRARGTSPTGAEPCSILSACSNLWATSVRKPSIGC